VEVREHLLSEHVDEAFLLGADLVHVHGAETQASVLL
jgi:hypothetical protein